MKALAAKGRPLDAILHAESDTTPWSGDIAPVCEAILLAAGLTDEAYRRYATRANEATTGVATFRAIVAKYPHKTPAEVLADLAAADPGYEGHWFAAAKDAGLFDEALALAERSTCDPFTLVRAAREFGTKRPTFAVAVGLRAIETMLTTAVRGDITPTDISTAVLHTIAAARNAGTAPATLARLRDLAGRGNGPLRGTLLRELASAAP